MERHPTYSNPKLTDNLIKIIAQAIRAALMLIPTTVAPMTSVVCGRYKLTANAVISNDFR